MAESMVAPAVITMTSHEAAPSSERSHCRPSPSGSFRSMSTTSGLSFASKRRASASEAAARVVKPSRWTSTSRMRRKLPSSSTISAVSGG